MDATLNDMTTGPRGPGEGTPYHSIGARQAVEEGEPITSFAERSIIPPNSQRCLCTCVSISKGGRESERPSSSRKHRADGDAARTCLGGHTNDLSVMEAVRRSRLKTDDCPDKIRSSVPSPVLRRIEVLGLRKAEVSTAPPSLE